MLTALHSEKIALEKQLKKSGDANKNISHQVVQEKHKQVCGVLSSSTRV